MESQLVKQVTALVDDLQACGGGGGRGVTVVGMATILTSLEECLSKLEKEEEVVGVGGVLLHPIDGIFGFVGECLKRRAAVTASLRSDATETAVADGGLKSAIDLVTSYLEKSTTFLKAADLTYVLRTAADLLRSTAATKGIAAFQASLFSPIIFGLEHSSAVGVPPSSLGLPVLFDTLLRIVKKTGVPQSKRLKKSSLEALGLITKLYPAESAGREKEVGAVFKMVLAGLVESQDPDLTVAAGVLEGLTHFFHHFSDSDDVKWRAVVYRFMSRGLDLTDHTRHEVPRAALRLLRDHGKFFKAEIVEDVEAVLARVRKLVMHRNVDVRKAALGACEPVAATVAQGVAGMSDRRRAGKTFKFVFNFGKNLAFSTSSTAPIHLTSFGILLLGHISLPVAMDDADMAGEILTLVLSRFADIFCDIPAFEGQAEDNIRMVPFFIDAVAAAVVNSHVLTPVGVTQVGEVVRTTFEHYSREYVFASTRGKINTSLVHLLLACYQKGDSLTKVLQPVIFQLLTTSLTAATPDTHIALWTAMLCSASPPYGLWSHPWHTILNLSSGQHAHMTSIIFDILASTVIGVLDRLDLTVSVDLEGSEPTPSSPNDFQLYLGIVEFWSAIFEKVSDTAVVDDWSLPLLLKYTEMAGACPQVSGFYKLLTGLVSRCEKAGYLRHAKLVREADGSVSVGDWEEGDEVPTQEAAPNHDKTTRVKEFQTILLKFIKQTMASTPDFQGELLITSITFLLSMPVRLLNLRAMPTPLTTALTTGLSYPPIAATAITAMESWLDSAPLEVQKYLAPSAVGILRSFLSAVHGRTVDNADESGPGAAAKKKSKTLTQRAENEIEQLRAIQERVVLVLGKLGSGVVAKLMSEGSEVGVGGWGVGAEKVVVRLPFGETKQDLAFDKILPRVCDLATTSNDRKTKAAGCELLHSLTLWMVGSNAHSMRNVPDGSDPTATPFHSVYRKIFPVITQLAVDPEPIAATLFSKLLHQLVHWFTQNAHYESKETMALLDTLTDGLSSSTNSALRTTCAVACAEFVKYSIKHGAQTATRNLLSITSRLHNMFMHPDPWKRHGAGAAFAKMLPEIYVNEDAVATHLLHGVYSAVLSLSMWEDGPGGDGTVSIEPTLNFLSKAERTVVRKTQLLTYKTDKRRVNLPTPARGLEPLVAWLLEQCFFEDRVARRWSMRLFLTFSSCLPGFDTEDGPRRWLAKTLKEKGGPEEIIATMESKIMKLPVSDSDLDQIGYEKYCLWAKDIETCADAYNWLFAHHLIDPTCVLAESHGLPSPPAKKKRGRGGAVASPTKSKPPTLLPMHVRVFLSHWVKGLGTAQFTRISLQQQAALASKRSLVYEAAVPLVTLLCNTYPELATPFLSPGYYLMLLLMMCQPSVLGYDPHSYRTQTEIPAMGKRGLQALLRVVKEGDGEVVEMAARVFEITKCDVFRDGAVAELIGDSDSGKKSVTEATYLIRGARGLHQLGVLHKAVQILHPTLTTKEDISASLAGNLALLPIDLLTQPGAKQIVREFWKLCFDLEISPTIIISLLTDPTPLTQSDLAQGRIAKSFSNLRAITNLEADDTDTAMQDPNVPTKGDIFYTTHRAEICEYLFTNPQHLKTIAETGYHRVLLDTAALCKASRNMKLRDAFVREAGRGLLPSLFEEASDEGVANVLNVASMLLSVGTKEAFPCEDKILQLLESQLTQPGVLRLHLVKLLNVCKAITSLVPYLLRTASDRVSRLLGTFIAEQLPVHHDEVFAPGAESLTRPYTTVVDALLDAMEASGSVAMLRVMLPLFRGTGSHPFGDKIGTVLGRFFEKLDEKTTVECADTCVKQFLNDELPADVRCAATNRICVLALQRLREGTCETFFAHHVVQLFKVTTDDWPGSKDPDESFSSLLSRTSAFTLLELMYRMCTPESTKNMINQAFAVAMLGKKVGHSQFSGKEMNDKIIRHSHAACTQALPCKTLVIDVVANGVTGKAAVLKYHQAAYGCLASALIATQTNQDLITRALFVPRKGDSLWENIINTEKQYVFEVKTAFGVTRRAIQGLRNEWDAKAEGTKRPKYMSSQYLMGSSLAAAAENPGAPVITASQVVTEGEKEEDEEAEAQVLSQNATQVVVPPMSVKKHKEMLSQDESAKPPPAVTPMKSQGRTWFGTQETNDTDGSQLPVVQGETDGDLEMDELNQMSVMSTVLRVVLFLKSYQNPDAREPPMWMAELLSKVASPTTHINVKLFLTKVVLNMPDVFREFASLWVAPLIETGVGSKAASPGISYFLRDVVMTLLSWNEEVRVTSFDVEGKASLLLENLLKCCSHFERRVLQSNLELIKIYVEQWKDRIRIGPEHKRIILGWLATSASSDVTNSQWVKARVTGLQLLGVLLTNGVRAYDPIADVSLMGEDEFYSRLVANLPPHPQNKILPKDLIEAAAEVVGMILHQHSELNLTCTALHDKASRKLRALHGSGNNEQFLLFLGGIVKHHPPAADEFLPHRLIRMLTHTRGAYKTLALDITTKRAEHFPSIYSEFHPFVSELLTTGSTDTKLLTFSLLAKAVAVSSPKDLSHFVVNLSADIKERLIPMGCLTLDAKVALYDCWIKVFDTKWEELNEQGRHCLTAHLLGGLQDNSTYIRDRLLRFWDDGTRLPTSVFKRLERLFVASAADLTLYSPDLGDKWLQYSSILLLFLSHRSPDFTDRTSFFRDPLTNCAYTEMVVDTSSDHRAAVSMTPMFASQDGSLDVDRQAGQIMATATQQSMAPATQTQTATNFAHYEPRKVTNMSLSQTTMLFQPFQADPVMPPPTTTMGASAQYHPYGHVMKRRFKKQNEERQTTGHAIYTTKQVMRRDAEQRRRRRTAASNVKMWRTYREGEVPDVQISPSGILLPLEALCLYDVETARLALSELFTRLYKSLTAPDDSQDASAGGVQSILGPLAAVTASGAVDKLKLRQMLTNSLVHMLSGMQKFPGVIAFAHTLLMDNNHVVAALPAGVVYQSSVVSRNVRSGVLLIERGIAQRAARVKDLEREMWKRGSGSLDSLGGPVGEEKGSEVKKLRKENKEAWMHIVKMYEYLGEEDAARSVVEERLLSGDAAQSIGLVITGEYEKALSALDAVIEKLGTQPADHDQGLLTSGEQEYFLKAEKRKCLRQLLKWEALSGECDAEVGLEDGAVWEPQNVEVLKCHVEAKCRMAQGDKALAQYMLDFSQDALQNPISAEVITNHFCLPLSLLALKGSSQHTARAYIDMAISATLKEWIAIPATQRSQSDIRSLLASLQPIVEVDEYLKLMLAGDQGKDISGTSWRLLKRWWNRCEAFDGDSLQWDVFTNSRSVLCKLLQTYVEQNARDCGTDSMITPVTISEHECSVLLKAASAMQDRGLSNPARGFLHQYAATREGTAISGGKLDVNFTVTAVKNSLARAKAAAPERAGKMFTKTLQYVEAEDAKHDIRGSHPVQYHLLKAEAYRGLAEHWLSKEEPEEMLAVAKKALVHYRDGAKVHGDRTKALEELGLFADTLLSRKEFKHAGTDAETVANLLVASYLGAIQSGESNVARVRLPRVLEIVESIPTVAQTIHSHVQKIDSWVLLPWVNQFVSYLGGRAGSVAASVLTKVSRKFPQQVFYALSASSDDLEKQAGCDPEVASRLAKLYRHVEAHLEDAESIKKFVSAIERVHNPDLRFKYWVEEIAAVLREYVAGTTPRTLAQDKANRLWSGMVRDLFDISHEDQSGLNKKFAERTTKLVQHGIKVGGKPLYADVEATLKPIIRKTGETTQQTLDAVTKKIREWQSAVKTSWTHAKASGPMPLSTFSTWLAEYKASAHGGELPILLPQQPFLYLDTNTPQQLPDISSFGPNVLVMNSIQKPKRIIIHGSDHAEYPFLLKGGEDLRQDQRIQQMFYLFNNCMGKDVKCKQRSLAVRGYSVIPISPRVGLVEWVANTTPIKAMIEGQLPSGGVQMQPASRKHHEFVVSMGKGSDWVAGFRALYGDHGKTDLQGKYEELVGEMDKGYLKKSMAALCASHAAFYTARNTFTSSFCASSIAQWIMGIGDRHLDNFLIDTSDLSIIPIDFGHAFGSATEVLHVPELMPIRLTPQLQEVWEPVGVSLLKGGMSACLECLRGNSRMLLDVLSIFVREPLSTWQRTAMKKSRKTIEGEGDQQQQKPHEAYSTAKLGIVKKKLSHVNPWVTAAEDLSGNTIALSTVLKHKNGPSNARAILKGRPGRNIRADAPKICRSTVEQVSCLIDMATDPNILCRTYMGWAPLF